MMDLIRKGNEQYVGNFSNNLVTNGGFKGTTCNKVAARGKFQSGGFSSKAVEGIGVNSKPLMVYKKTKSNILPKRGNNNFPVSSPKIKKLSKSLQSGGSRKTRRMRNKRLSKKGASKHNVKFSKKVKKLKRNNNKTKRAPTPYN